MLLENKKFVLKDIKTLTIKVIEDFINSKGYQPLRWAVVDIKNEEFVVEATCFKN